MKDGGRGLTHSSKQRERGSFEGDRDDRVALSQRNVAVMLNSLQ